MDYDLCICWRHQNMNEQSNMLVTLAAGGVEGATMGQK